MSKIRETQTNHLIDIELSVAPEFFDTLVELGDWLNKPPHEVIEIFLQEGVENYKATLEFEKSMDSADRELEGTPEATT